MATTVTAENCTITITESYTLNGVSYGNTTNKTYTSQGEVIQRVMSIGVAFTEIFNATTIDGRGQVVVNDWAYFRITNLDDTNFLTLRLYDSTDSQFFKIEAGESFFLMSPEIDIDASGTTFNAFSDVNEIGAIADTAACDVELMMVTA